MGLFRDLAGLAAFGFVALRAKRAWESRRRRKNATEGAGPTSEAGAGSATQGSDTDEVPTQRSGGPGPDSPLEIPPKGWKATAKRTLKEIKDDRISFAAAAMAYYFFLAIFPALIAIVGILGLVSVDAQGLIRALRDSLPGGAGVALTSAVANADRTSDAASLAATVGGIAVALWSASAGMAALQTGLNVAYDVPRERKFLKKRGVALLLLAATLVLGGVPSPIFTFGDSTLSTALGWVLTVAAVMILFSVFYYFGPNRDRPTWRWVSAGGVIGGLLWIVASLIFGLYISTFNSYGKTYGPLAGVVVLVLWLYLSSIAVLVGGELNAELERQASDGTP